MMNTGLRLILLWIKLCTKRQVHQSVTKVSLNSDRCSDIDVTFRSKSTLVLFVDAACERPQSATNYWPYSAYAGHLCSY